jgi:hypothetical protein
VAAELRHICDVFAEQKEFNSDEMEKLAVCLSLCCSVLSFPGCQGVANTSDAEVLSYGLSFFLREKSTRMLTQHGLKGIVRTPEGRRVTLVTSTLAGSTAAASLFQRLVAIAFHVPRHSAAAAAPAAGLRSSTSVGTTPEVLLALEIAAVCLGHPDGGDGFSHAVQKVRGLDALERWVLALDKQRTPLPMAFMRFLCALSFHADAQLQIAQKEELMTVLIEASGACNERGSLCLFVLRNMCFHSSLKTQMCQDSRFLVVAKSALMLRTQAVDLSAPQGSGSGGGGSGSWSAGRQTMEVATGGAAGQEAYRRQEIAASALWALVYNNQRAKTYVRGLLKQATPVSLKSATVVDFVSTPALRSYATLMNQNISGLASLGLD